MRPHADDAGLRAESLPRHVAVVMDGNSRWARARGLPSAAGHEAGRRALEEVMRLSRAWGVRALTAFAFSHEPREPEPAQGMLPAPARRRLVCLRRASPAPFANSQVEVEFLMGQLERAIRQSVA